MLGPLSLHWLPHPKHSQALVCSHPVGYVDHLRAQIIWHSYQAQLLEGNKPEEKINVGQKSSIE